MKHKVVIPEQIATGLRAHLFQNSVEQGAFLFATAERHDCGLTLTVEDFYQTGHKWKVRLHEKGGSIMRCLPTITWSSICTSTSRWPRLRQ